MKNIKVLLALILSVSLIFVICSCDLFGGNEGSGEGGSETEGEGESKLLTFKEYIELSMEEQIAYVESFADIDSYFAWYNVAKAEYELLYGPIGGTPDSGDGDIDVDLGGDTGDDDGPDVNIGLGDKVPEDDNKGDDSADNPTTEGGGNEGDNPGDDSTTGDGNGNEGDKPADGDSSDGDGTILLTWEEYITLSSDAQAEYIASFADIEAFFAWQDAALKAYNDANKGDDLPEDGNIDLGGK